MSQRQTVYQDQKLMTEYSFTHPGDLTLNVSVYDSKNTQSQQRKAVVLCINYTLGTIADLFDNGMWH